jgi:protein-disulfide isomerase
VARKQAKTRKTEKDRQVQSTRKSPLTPFYAVLGAIAVAGVGLILYQVLARGGSAATEPVEVNIEPSELASVQGISIGDANAPVVIYEFADFQCPACANYASLVAPTIKQRLVDTGLARYVHHDYPLTQIHPHAFLAARAGRCANEQGGFWHFHDLVYARQMRWASMGDPSDFFVDVADEVGIDDRAFAACLRSDRYAEEITRSMRLGESMGVPGTPTLFVNMRRLPNIPTTSSEFAELEAMVRSEAGMAGGQPTAADTAADTAGGTGTVPVDTADAPAVEAPAPGL